MMTPDELDILLRLGIALAVGATIGIERSYSGRSAGFRTHALVCVSCALLMLVTAYGHVWIPEHLASGRVVLDPTRMAQGIMTGIGFLGAGAILKSGNNIHGLTTAASIWTTAAIGILVGIGFFFPAMVTAGITLVVLSVFRWIEAKTPAMVYAHCVVRFAPHAVLPENEMRELVTKYGFSIVETNYRLNSGREYFEYRFVIRTTRSSQARKLSEALTELPAVREFSISPSDY